MTIDAVYIPVFPETNEGRQSFECNFFFLTEQEAWDYIGARPGVMGRLPQGGKTWQHSSYKDYDVRRLPRFSDVNLTKRERIDRLAAEMGYSQFVDALAAKGLL